MRNSSLQAKLISAFLIVIAVLLIAEAFFVGLHLIIVKKYQSLTDTEVSEYSLIQSSDDLVTALYDYIKSNNSSTLALYDDQRKVLDATLQKLDRNITDGDSITAYAGLKNTIDGIISDCDNGVKANLAGNFLQALDLYNNANNNKDFVKDNAITLLLAELEYNKKVQANIAFTELVSEIFGIVLFLLTCLGCLWYAVAYSRHLVSPLKKLTALAKVIERGNLNAIVEKNILRGNDEIASLANSFNSMVIALNNNIKQLRDYNERLIRTKKIVTDKEIRISQLQEVNRMKDEFMNIVTHELKTPLIPIIGLSEVMGQKKELLPAEFQGYVNIIHEQAERLASLIRQILTASRSKRAGLKNPPDTFNLDDFLLAQRLPLQELAKRTKAKIEFKIAGQGIKIASDKEKISQIIFNLVDNAVKYGPNGQTITIALSQPTAQTAKVEIIDQGRGIPPELQDLLFQKFSQLEPSASRSREGMGLGLYLCKQNIDYLGGKIGVKSQAGHGSNFYFTLPLNQADPNIKK
ncbi:MAG TPA: ATP-binding protein [Candidatus Nanoarchaeia archaeon]|nr:ATP-binding protein [Candidatus Nanoarchaeia archaeon]